MFTLDELNDLRLRAELHEHHRADPDPLGLLFQFLELLEKYGKGTAGELVLSSQDLLVRPPFAGGVQNCALASADPAEEAIAPADPVEGESAVEGDGSETATTEDDAEGDGTFIGPDGLIRGVWADDEIAYVIMAYERGDPIKHIAAKLGRPVPATGFRIKILKRDGAIEGRGAERNSEDGEGDQITSADEEPEADADGVDDAGPDPYTNLPPPRPARIVGQMPYPGGRQPGWSTGQDFRLMEGLAQGRKSAEMAQELGKDKAETIARAKTMLAAFPGLDGQIKMMKALRLHRDAEALANGEAA